MGANSPLSSLNLILIVGVVTISGFMHPLTVGDDFETRGEDDTLLPARQLLVDHPERQNSSAVFGIEDCADNREYLIKSQEGDRSIWIRVTENCVTWPDTPVLNITITNNAESDAVIDGTVTANVRDGPSPVIKVPAVLSNENDSTPSTFSPPTLEPPLPSESNQSNPPQDGSSFEVTERFYVEPPPDSPDYRHVLFGQIPEDGTRFNVTVTIDSNIQQESKTMVFTLVVKNGGTEVIAPSSESRVMAFSAPKSSPVGKSYLPVCSPSPPQDGLDAEFSYEPERPEVGEPITFDASISSPEEQLVEYRWDFNDAEGESKTDVVKNSPEATHLYDESGRYLVNLTVVDAEGDTDSEACSIRVRDENTEISGGQLLFLLVSFLLLIISAVIGGRENGDGIIDLLKVLFGAIIAGGLGFLDKGISTIFLLMPIGAVILGGFFRMVAPKTGNSLLSSRSILG